MQERYAYLKKKRGKNKKKVDGKGWVKAVVPSALLYGVHWLNKRELFSKPLSSCIQNFCTLFRRGKTGLKIVAYLKICPEAFKDV